MGQRRTSAARRAGMAVFAAATVIALAACSSGTGFPITINGETTIQSLRIPITPALQTYYDQTIDWQACEGDYCASVRAPLDWDNPSAGHVRLALIKHPASGHREGTLLINPGGPGQSGVEYVGDDPRNVVDSTIEKHFDVIGFDPPGVGYSTAVDCGGASGLDRYLYGQVPGAIGSKEWIAATKAKNRQFGQECARDTGKLLGHIDTITAARDLDLIRGVLHQPRLNYLGYSYGTYLGTVYAGLFPDRVGRFIFDGPEDPWYGQSSSSEGVDDGDVDQANSFDAELNVYLRECLAGKTSAIGSTTCPFTGTLADAQHSVERELTKLTATPLPAAKGRVLTAATLSTAISEAMYDPTEWPRLTKMFVQLTQSNATLALEFADEYNDRDSSGHYEDNSAEFYQAIGCLEDGSEIDLHYDARQLAQLKKSAPILGQYAAYLDLTCYDWPEKEAPFPTPIQAAGAPPILVVATTGDPATPYAGAKALVHQLATAHIVTFHGNGHTAYDLGHACVDEAVDSYLRSGTVPKTDPQCH